MTRIAAFSRKFPPEYKRRWYIVKCGNWYKLRYGGRTVRHNGIPLYYSWLNDALDDVELRNYTLYGKD